MHCFSTRWKYWIRSNTKTHLHKKYRTRVVYEFSVNCNPTWALEFFRRSMRGWVSQRQRRLCILKSVFVSVCVYGPSIQCIIESELKSCACVLASRAITKSLLLNCDSNRKQHTLSFEAKISERLRQPVHKTLSWTKDPKLSYSRLRLLSRTVFSFSGLSFPNRCSRKREPILS